MVLFEDLAFCTYFAYFHTLYSRAIAPILRSSLIVMRQHVAERMRSIYWALLPHWSSMFAPSTVVHLVRVSSHFTVCSVSAVYVYPNRFKLQRTAQEDYGTCGCSKVDREQIYYEI